ETWANAATVTGATGWSHTVVFSTPQVGKRYVRVTLDNRVGADYRLQELEVWGVNDLDISLPPAPAPEADGTQYLTGGNWKVARAYQMNTTGEALSTAAGASVAGNWIPATVPGTVITSYIDAGAIVDPDFSDWQMQVSDSYFTQSDWWYTNNFTIPASQQGKRTWLNFQAINWKANVYLNGHRLGNAAGSVVDGEYDLNGAYTSNKLDITAFANYGGANYLAVLIKKVDYPGAPTVQTLASAGGNGGWLGGDNPTVHASVGWDWLPTIRGRNVGIYEDVFLTYSGNVRIENSWGVNALDTVTKDFSKADVTLKGDLTNATDQVRYALVTATINPSGTAVANPMIFTIPPKSTVEYDLPTVTITNPDIWWPAGYGDQPLYDVSVSVHEAATLFGPFILSDTEEYKHGIRVFEFEWRSQPELNAYDATAARNPHAGMNIYANGTRVIGRGGNWGLSDRNMANTAEDFDLKMRLHKEANLNIIRNWVGMTGHPGFYEAADKYGIMIMDDFWLANPSDGPNAHDEVMFAASALAKVKKVRHHAALTFYCGRNEGNPSNTLEAFLRGMTATGTGTVDPTHTYIANSAHPREGLDGHGPYGVRDAVWYFDNTPAASGYNSNGNGAKNLSTERGMLNVPTMESMKRMLGDSIPWPPVTATPGVNVWGIHDFTTGGATEAARLLDHITNTYDPGYQAHGFADFISTVQLLNYDMHRALYESVYVNDTPGLMQWMSQSAWPSMAWQTYDFWYDLNGGFYGEKAGNKPINAILDLRDQTIFLSNETKDALTNVTVKAEVFSLTGTKIGESSVVTSLKAGGRSSEFTLAEDIAKGGIAVGQLIYRRVGPPLLEMPVIAGYSGTRFVRTSVVNTAGTVLSTNFYWDNPDVKAVWPAGSRTSRGTNSPSPWANYQAIRTTLKGTDAAPVAPVSVIAHVVETASPEPGWAGLDVTLTNHGTLPALQAHINGKDENGEQILPFIADDNYITLMPGESRTLHVKYLVAGLQGTEMRVGLDGFNITPRTFGLPADPVDVERLRQMIAVYSLFEAAQARYTPESFAPFAAAMAAGRAALATVPPERDPVEWALVAIPATADALEEAINTDLLEALIAQAEQILANAPAYVAASLVGLAEAVASAKAVLASPATQAQVTAEEIALALAVAKATPKGDKTGLRALISVAQTLKSDSFTPASWAPVAAALAAGIAVDNDPEASVYQVDDAFDALAGALQALVLRAAKAGLKSAIDVGDTIMASADAYVASSLAGLGDALTAAKAVYNDHDATASEVSAAQTALLAKIALARLKAADGSSVALLSTAALASLALDPAATTKAVLTAKAASVKAFVKAPAPKIKGKAKVGALLWVKAGSWSPSAKLSYQWYRDGVKVAKATKSVYKARKADKGKKLTVVVTAKKAGFTTAAKASKATKKIR
ncbi:MAG: hypothetical protein FWD59_02705, partial [Micrococcales bacterium]|nr:hypothetical protein [Micrococcales bacterium]